MSAFFDLPSFIRRVSNPLLQRFFSDVEAFAEFDWATAGTRKTGPILQRFNLTTADSEGWRSAFRSDGDHESEVMSISNPS